MPNHAIHQRNHERCFLNNPRTSCDNSIHQGLKGSGTTPRRDERLGLKDSEGVAPSSIKMGALFGILGGRSSPPRNRCRRHLALPSRAAPVLMAWPWKQLLLLLGFTEAVLGRPRREVQEAGSARSSGTRLPSPGRHPNEDTSRPESRRKAPGDHAYASAALAFCQGRLQLLRRLTAQCMATRCARV